MPLKNGHELGENIKFMLLRSGNKTLDTGVFIGSGTITERFRDFEFDLGRSKVPLGSVIGERHLSIPGESQYGGLEFGQPLEQVAALARLGPCLLH